MALAAPETGAENWDAPRLHRMDNVIMAARAFEADPESYTALRAELGGGDILTHAV
ncbi:hypothetical protein [Primorskyibacter sedentarius]|uniref:hypothetical protein n=1 Tax=Primorskyibacter sedentarius TaxID=745311 RepID=UPI00140555E7|nr:hypothetical protein [Primorskyibacter sedentarius]